MAWMREEKILTLVGVARIVVVAAHLKLLELPVSISNFNFTGTLKNQRYLFLLSKRRLDLMFSAFFDKTISITAFKRRS